MVDFELTLRTFSLTESNGGSQSAALSFLDQLTRSWPFSRWSKCNFFKLSCYKACRVALLSMRRAARQFLKNSYEILVTFVYIHPQDANLLRLVFQLVGIFGIVGYKLSDGG